ncbi:hypothetical protein ACFFLZ_13055 [Photobacterium aphoticum]|uniref:Lipoprotein n=1 Tax=Photobacterium aphoticum TaxID=754436 RepID=A0A0J1JCT9_9GAMM|nr:hypothetical protein [Photobacterium aphoticum]KLU99481.1 hypothetical protein ABT58_16625 [Photobacterium aphoticum]PSU55845.1 hypothetical protein C9I90_15010 [Photobacterium aphoticum]GHA52703.1 hypothetical protein GCM10007086_28540 [Photobacterium aphoticum]
MKAKISIAAITVVSLFGCQTTGNQYPSLTLKEANSFIESVNIQPYHVQPEIEQVWIQPVNKTEACLLETSPQFKAEANARAVWDGACKNGYADGFGRDITISDYSHVEEITTYQNGSTLNQYSVMRDYVNNLTVRRFKNDLNKYVGSIEFITDSSTNFNVLIRTGVFDEKTGNYRYVESSPFNPIVSYVNRVDGKVSYIFNDMTNQIGEVKSSTFTQNSLTGQYGGIIRFVMKNGYVQSEKINQSGNQIVNVPGQFWKDIDSELEKITPAISEGNNAYNNALTLETKYKHKVCNSDNPIIPRGITYDEYTAMCYYDLKFTEKYKSTMEAVSNKYNADLNKYQSEQYKQQELAIKRREAEAAESRAAAAHKQSAAAGSSGFNNTVQCYKMGQFLNKEIKTFNGMICPIGWLQYSGW